MSLLQPSRHIDKVTGLIDTLFGEDSGMPARELDFKPDGSLTEAMLPLCDNAGDPGWYDETVLLLHATVRSSIRQGVAVTSALCGGETNAVTAFGNACSTDETRLLSSYKDVPHIIAAVLVPTVLSYLPGASVNVSRVGRSQNRGSSAVRSHKDENTITDGLSVIIPLSGPRAHLFGADVEFEVDPDLNVEPRAMQFEYGIGDIAVIRQRITVEEDFRRRIVQAADHTGVCFDDDRELMAIDFHSSETICLD